MDNIKAAKVIAYMSKWCPSDLARISVIESESNRIVFLREGAKVGEMRPEERIFPLRGGGDGTVIDIEIMLKSLSEQAIYPDTIDIGIYEKELFDAVILSMSEAEKHNNYTCNVTP